MEKFLFCFFIRQIACQFIKTRAHKLETLKKHKMLP